MNDLKSMLDTAFTKLCDVSFCGKDAEKVADIKCILRQVFQKLDEYKEVNKSDG